MLAVSVEVSPELLAVGLRTRLGESPSLAVVDESGRADVVVTDSPWSGSPTAQLWAVHEPPTPRALRDALLLEGASGVILLDRDVESWVLAARAVAAGGTWLDPSDAIAGEVIVAAFGDDPRATSLGLTRQELRVLRLLPSGRTNAEIGSALGVSRSTVKTHLSNAFRKLVASDRSEAVRRAKEVGLLD